MLLSWQNRKKTKPKPKQNKKKILQSTRELNLSIGAPIARIKQPVLCLQGDLCVHLHLTVTWPLAWTPGLTANGNDALTEGLISYRGPASHHWLSTQRLVECEDIVSASSRKSLAVSFSSVPQNRWSQWTKGQPLRRRLVCPPLHRGRYLVWWHRSPATQVFPAPPESLAPYFIIILLSSSESQWDEREIEI